MFFFLFLISFISRLVDFILCKQASSYFCGSTVVVGREDILVHLRFYQLDFFILDFNQAEVFSFSIFFPGGGEVERRPGLSSSEYLCVGREEVTRTRLRTG